MKLLLFFVKLLAVAVLLPLLLLLYYMCAYTPQVSCLLGEMERLSGQVRWHLPSQVVGLTGQRPWLLNASVRDNVLLGAPMRDKRYRKVMAACDLVSLKSTPVL